MRATLSPRAVRGAGHASQARCGSGRSAGVTRLVDWRRDAVPAIGVQPASGGVSSQVLPGRWTNMLTRRSVAVVALVAFAALLVARPASAADPGVPVQAERTA